MQNHSRSSWRRRRQRTTWLQGAARPEVLGGRHGMATRVAHGHAHAEDIQRTGHDAGLGHGNGPHYRLRDGREQLPDFGLQDARQPRGNQLRPLHDDDTDSPARVFVGAASEMERAEGESEEREYSGDTCEDGPRGQEVQRRGWRHRLVGVNAHGQGARRRRVASTTGGLAGRGEQATQHTVGGAGARYKFASFVALARDLDRE